MSSVDKFLLGTHNHIEILKYTGKTQLHQDCDSCSLSLLPYACLWCHLQGLPCCHKIAFYKNKLTEKEALWTHCVCKPLDTVPVLCNVCIIFGSMFIANTCIFGHCLIQRLNCLHSASQRHVLFSLACTHHSDWSRLSARLWHLSHCITPPRCGLSPPVTSVDPHITVTSPI